jgi:hypothetical protein
MSKILKNNTASPIAINDTGIEISASPGQYIIPPQDYPLWAASANVLTSINSGNIIVNDGTNNLSIADGIKYLELSEKAKGIRFDNSTNGFVSVEVQSAIEEMRTSAVGGTTIPISFSSTGNTANKWLGNTISSNSSNQVPLVLINSSILCGITFSNADNNVDINVEIYTNGSLVYTWQIRNKRTAYIYGIVNNMNQGDRVSVFMRQFTGGSGDATAQDPIISLYFRTLTDVSGSGGTQNSV